MDKHDCCLSPVSLVSLSNFFISKCVYFLYYENMLVLKALRVILTNLLVSSASVNALFFSAVSYSQSICGKVLVAE